MYVMNERKLLVCLAILFCAVFGTAVVVSSVKKTESGMVVVSEGGTPVKKVDVVPTPVP